MPRCPNCFRETMRTKDWACFLCGYPLSSPAFKLVDKTYGQIREERLYGKKPPVEPAEQIDDSYEPENDIIKEMQEVPLVTENNISEEVDTVKSDDAIVIEDEYSEEPVIAQEISGCKTATEEIDEEADIEDKNKYVEEDEEDNELEIIEPSECNIELIETIAVAEEDIEASDVKFKEEPESPLPIAEELEEEPVQAEPEPVCPADIDITIDELLSEYAEDYISATNKYLNKVLRLSGCAAAIDVKEVLAINYIRMTDASLNLTKSVQCMFDKKHADNLRDLEKGQRVIVQGKYTGSLIAMRMTDCILI